MSVLIYQGDTIDNFGKYLPTPYIEKVIIGDDALATATVSLFIKLAEGEKINDVLGRLNDQLSIYLLIVANKEKEITAGTTSIDAEHDHEYSIGSLGNGWAAMAYSPTDELGRIHHRHRILNGVVQENQSNCYPNCKEEYGSKGGGPHVHNLQSNESIERVLSGELNVFEYYRSVLETNNADTHSWAQLWALRSGDAGLYLEEDKIVEDFYDENGDRIIKFTSDLFTTLLIGNTFEWSTANDLTFLSFSSTYSYYEDAEDLDVELENKTFFSKQTSDIAYEKIFENGVLVNQLQVEFFDSSGTIYNGHPLQSINGVYYKSDNITHEAIVGYFNKLLGETSAGRCGKLQKMKDRVAYILATHGDKADLVPELNSLRKVFPDKSPATPIGKFYFRFKKRIFTTNKKIQMNPQISKKVIRNPKFVDERSVPAASQPQTSWDGDPAGHSGHYLYKRGYMGRTALYSFPGVRTDTQQAEIAQYEGANWDIQANTLTDIAWGTEKRFDVIVRNAGYFFFDYEKALRRAANINKIVNVERLISYGIPTEYNYFYVDSAQIIRVEGPVENQDKVTISMEARRSGDALYYPLTETTKVSQMAYALDSNIVIPSPGFYSDYTPAGEESKLVLTQQENTNLIIRNFEPIQTSEISSKIPDYRLMCFEFQDFMDDDLATSSDTDSYETQVTVQDRTVNILKEFAAQYTDALHHLDTYISKAQKDFSYDESTGLFNDFFIEGIEAEYFDDANAPWYRAPVLFNLHRDLLYNVFDGSLSDIFEDSQNIMNNINPFNGSYFALIEFRENMNTFFEDNYGTGAHIAAQIEAIDYTASHTFSSTLSYASAGTTDEPYGVVYTDSGYRADDGGGTYTDPGDDIKGPAGTDDADIPDPAELAAAAFSADAFDESGDIQGEEKI